MIFRDGHKAKVTYRSDKKWEEFTAKQAMRNRGQLAHAIRSSQPHARAALIKTLRDGGVPSGQIKRLERTTRSGRSITRGTVGTVKRTWRGAAWAAELVQDIKQTKQGKAGAPKYRDTSRFKRVPQHKHHRYGVPHHDKTTARRAGKTAKTAQKWEVRGGRRVRK